MKIVESTIVFPLAIFIISLIIVTSLNFFSNTYNDVKEKHEELKNIYEISIENEIRIKDAILDEK